VSTPDNRILIVILLGVIGTAVVGFGGLKFFVDPIRDRDTSIAVLQGEMDKKRQEVNKIMAEKAKLERWRQMSLPADVDLASREYERFLSDLLRHSHFAPDGLSIDSKKSAKNTATLPGKKEPIYTTIAFNVKARGELSSLISFMEKFYHTGLLHEIKDLSIQRQRTVSPGQKPTDLDISFGIETLVLKEAENRPYLTPIDERLVIADVVAAMRQGPTGLALAVSQAGPAGPLGPRHLADGRQYNSILAKNMFFGPLPKIRETPVAPVEDTVKRDRTDVKQFVVLTDITVGPTKTEAWMFDRYNGPRSRLQVSRGFDLIRVRDGSGTLIVDGKVVKIMERDVIFSVSDKYYAFHVGATLKEAMAQSLSDAQIKEYGLKPLKGTTPGTISEEELKQMPKELPSKPEPGPEKEENPKENPEKEKD
jgi:hypothetical protein